MKKLLALVLCVMLFVSIIPTAAFATTPKSAGEIIGPAYAAQKALYNKIGQFGVLNTIAGLYNGFLKAYPKYIEAKDLKALADAFTDVKENPDHWGTTNVNNIIAVAYNNAAFAFVNNAVVPAIEKEQKAVEAKIDALKLG